MKNVRTSNRLTEITEKFRNAGNKLTLLDFDGTLVDFTSNTADTIPSEGLLNLLQKVADIPDNQLIIITGREMDEIDRMVGHLPIDIIAEHGAMIRENNIWRKSRIYKALTTGQPEAMVTFSGKPFNISAIS